MAFTFESGESFEMYMENSKDKLILCYSIPNGNDDAINKTIRMVKILHKIAKDYSQVDVIYIDWNVINNTVSEN